MPRPVRLRGDKAGTECYWVLAWVDDLGGDKGGTPLLRGGDGLRQADQRMPAPPAAKIMGHQSV